MKKCMITLLLLLMLVGLCAQFDERAILTQQAFQLMARRQYSEAEQLFIQILEKYPDDVNSINQLIQIYFLASQIDKAEAALEKYRRHMPPAQYTEQRILLYIMQGKSKEAWQLSLSYIEQHNHDQNRYRLLASYFERRGFFEQVLELYTNARKHYAKSDLFTLEYAAAALNFRQYREALQEYLRFLDANPGNLFFVNNQCKTILQEDPTLIKVIAEFSSKAVNPVILELYAISLMNLKEPFRALEIYKSLSLDKLKNFADEQYAALNDDVAFPAYEHLANVETDDLKKADYRYRKAQIKIRNAAYTEAHDILWGIINDQGLIDRRQRNRSTVNLDSRKMMAELILSTSGVVDSALVWYDKAKEFARNSYEIAEIDLEIAKLMAMSENYASATKKLAGINEFKLFESRDFYTLIINLMQGNIAKADTLMNEYIISYPGSKYTNDAIYLLMLVYGLQESDQALFMQAWRQKQLQQSASVISLLQIFEQSGDEELRLLAVEWALQLADKESAMRILNYEWKDATAAEYAALIKLKLISDSEYEQRFAREFLKQNPNSIFSPNFRQVISRMNIGKPNL